MDLNAMGGGAGDFDSAAMQADAGGMGFTLADLAAFDTSELSPMMTRLFPAGVHVVKIKAVALSESVSQDPAKPSLFRIGWQYECLEGNPISREIDPETLTGRTLNESYTLWPKDMQEGIQLTMGRYKKVNLPHKGPLGGLKDGTPGWLDSAVEQVIKLRVRHFTRKDGSEQAGFDWLPYESANEMGNGADAGVMVTGQSA